VRARGPVTQDIVEQGHRIARTSQCKDIAELAHRPAINPSSRAGRRQQHAARKTGLRYDCNSLEKRLGRNVRLSLGVRYRDCWRKQNGCPERHWELSVRLAGPAGTVESILGCGWQGGCREGSVPVYSSRFPKPQQPNSSSSLTIGG